jgi:hypothetical protein
MLGMPPRLKKKAQPQSCCQFACPACASQNWASEKNAASRNVVAESTRSCLANILKSMLQITKLNNATRQIQ